MIKNLLTPEITLQVCEWILCRSSFQADVICYNLLIEAYGQSSLVKKAESTYLALLEARCVPTEDTYALLLKSYSKCGMLEKAEAAFSEMRKNGLPPSMFACFSIWYCTYYRIKWHHNHNTMLVKTFSYFLFLQMTTPHPPCFLFLSDFYEFLKSSTIGCKLCTVQKQQAYCSGRISVNMSKLYTSYKLHKKAKRYEHYIPIHLMVTVVILFCSTCKIL